MSNIVLKTITLKTMLSKVMRGVINNNVLPITSWVGLELKNGVFSMIATDRYNYIKVMEHKLIGNDFKVTISADKFNKLIQKTTTETVTLTLNSTHLHIKGNGNYNLELPTDEDGLPSVFPEVPTIPIGTKEVVLASSIQSVIASNKSSLATNLDHIYLTGYYCGETTVTSNGIAVASNSLRLFEKPFLAPQELPYLLTTISQERIDVTRNADTILFETEDIVIYSTELQEAAKYPYAACINLFESNFGSSCTILRQALLDVIERVSLFTNSDDKSVVYVSFTLEGIDIKSKKATGIERITYINGNAAGVKFTPFTCCVDLNQLKAVIASQKSEFVDINYGNSVVLKFENANVSYLIALSEDDRLVTIPTVETDEESIEDPSDEMESDDYPYDDATSEY